MADPLLSFRTVTEAFVVRYDLVGGILTPTPIALPSNPDEAVLAPGFSVEDLKQTSCKGESQVILTYLNETVPELSMSFGSATPEIEAALLNRIAVTEANTEGWVYFSAVADDTAVAAKTAGNFGFDVAAQAPGTSEALVYYIDPDSKLAVPMTIVAGAPAAINEIAIGASLEITISAALAATGYNLYGWVPGVIFPSTTQVGSASPLLYGAFLMGVCFDGTVRQLTAQRLSWIPGGDFTKEPGRQMKFRILADGADKTGLGYSIGYIPQTLDC